MNTFCSEIIVSDIKFFILANESTKKSLILPGIDFTAATKLPILTPSNIIGINKPNWKIYQYSYNLNVLEERYNVLTFTSGNAALMYAR